MRSEVRPPPPVEERGPQFHHCQISDIYKMCRSGDRVGLSGLIQSRLVHAGQGGVGLVGLGWSGLVRVVKIFGLVGLGWGGWLGGGGLECG